jgi:hypothetical protein
MFVSINDIYFQPARNSFNDLYKSVKEFEKQAVGYKCIN